MSCALLSGDDDSGRGDGRLDGDEDTESQHSWYTCNDDVHDIPSEPEGAGLDGDLGFGAISPFPDFASWDALGVFRQSATADAADNGGQSPVTSERTTDGSVRETLSPPEDDAPVGASTVDEDDPDRPRWTKSRLVLDYQAPGPSMRPSSSSTGTAQHVQRPVQPADEGRRCERVRERVYYSPYVWTGGDPDDPREEQLERDKRRLGLLMEYLEQARRAEQHRDRGSSESPEGDDPQGSTPIPEYPAPAPRPACAPQATPAPAPQPTPIPVSAPQATPIPVPGPSAMIEDDPEDVQGPGQPENERIFKHGRARWYLAERLMEEFKRMRDERRDDEFLLRWLPRFEKPPQWTCAPWVEELVADWAAQQWQEEHWDAHQRWQEEQRAAERAAQQRWQEQQRAQGTQRTEDIAAHGHGLQHPAGQMGNVFPAEGLGQPSEQLAPQSDGSAFTIGQSAADQRRSSRAKDRRRLRRKDR